uniref:Uncharacterized protein n=1 Tax=Romanomermis culicivorax TaxID=13658 RepID=A0A915IGQ7_ROMCU
MVVYNGDAEIFLSAFRKMRNDRRGKKTLVGCIIKMLFNHAKIIKNAHQLLLSTASPKPGVSTNVKTHGYLTNYHQGKVEAALDGFTEYLIRNRVIP